MKILNLKHLKRYCEIDNFDLNQFFLIQQIKILIYCEAYHQFFNEGQQFFKEFNLEVLNLTKQMNEVKEKINQKRAKRSKREKNTDVIVRSNSIIQVKSFSIPLEELMDKVEGKMLPDFLDKSISYIKEHGLKIPSIFRTAPPKANLEDAKKKIDLNTIEWNEINDIHIYTGIIKLFLKELPEPLMTFELFDQFIKIPSIENEEERLAELKRVIDLMPQYSLLVFRSLMHLLFLVEENKEFNKMTSLNLSAVFTPLILYPEEPNPETMVDDIEKSKEVVNIIITNANKLFDDPSKDKKEKKKNKKKNESKSKSKSTKIKLKKSRSLTKKSSLKKKVPSTNEDSKSPRKEESVENTVDNVQEEEIKTEDNENIENSNIDTTNTSEVIESKEDKEVNIEDVYDDSNLIPLPESYTVLKDIQFNDEYFTSFEDLLDSVHAFSKEATFSDPSKNFRNINDSLKLLAKAAKDFLKSNMTLSSTLPNSINNLIIESGNNFSKQLLQTASALKNVSIANGNQSDTFDIIKEFILSLNEMFNTIREYLLYDEFYLISKELSILIDSFLNDISIPLDQLKIVLLKFKSISTSKSFETHDNELLDCISKCDSILNYLNAQNEESIKLKPMLQHLKHLAISATINHTRNNNMKFDSNSSFNIISEQVEMMKKDFEKVKSLSFKDIMSQLESVINQVLILVPTVKSAPISNKEDFLNFSFLLAKNIGKLSRSLRDIIEGNKNEPYSLALHHYIRTLWMLSLYMKISTFSTTYDIINDSNSHLNSISIIKDFVFIIHNMISVFQEMY